jgi:hypothetical protein
MSVVVRYNPASLTAAKYDEAVQRVNNELGLSETDPPEGCDLHVCFGTDGDLRISEIWESREQWEAFGEKLMPILQQVGIDPGQPDVYEVHRLEMRDGAAA